MPFIYKSSNIKSMPYCCGVLEIGCFGKSMVKQSDRYGEIWQTEGKDFKEAAEKLVQKFKENADGYLLCMNFYRNNDEKEYDQVLREVEASELDEQFECFELMDAFEAAGAKEVARYINPNSMNEVRCMMLENDLHKVA